MGAVMDIGELVGFKKRLFFEGAVQLRWAQDNPARARVASENFVFHGPRYHGVSEGGSAGVSRAYKLTDTATFIHDILDSLCSSFDAKNDNPFLLAVAGYGSGKSHFALTASQLLSQPSSQETVKILRNIYAADEEIGRNVDVLLRGFKKPALVVTLDGMSNFHLGNELSREIIRQIKKINADLEPIKNLSPRFKYAEVFFERNYDIRKVEFDKAGLPEDFETIVHKLQEQDEQVYSIIDDVFYETNGHRIPVDGQESAQALIKTVCDAYCGEEGPFSALVILFDEFGRYLEYVAEKPNLAGDSALQQIFQGIQDSVGKARLIGFIQYELKAYLNRFNQQDTRKLERYTSRFDNSGKIYLSTNLETLFAHLIEKRDEQRLRLAFENYPPENGWKESHDLFSKCLPGFKRIPVWADFEKFQKVIVEGCWPLHPITTWFLTRQKDIVQSRSALTIIKDAIDNVTSQPHQVDGKLFYISPAELVLKSMLQEIVTAERAQGGDIAETLLAILEKYKARLTSAHEMLLVGVMVLNKLRIETREKLSIDKILGYISGLSGEELKENFTHLRQEIGAVEWNADLSRYELISDAATRGQFVILMHKKNKQLNSGKIKDIFIHRGEKYTGLTDIVPDFSQKINISTTEWLFKTSFADSRNVKVILKESIDEWKNAYAHNDPKGQVIYVLVREKENFDTIVTDISAIYKRNLGNKVAPIWSIVLHDRDNKISEYLARIHILEEEFNSKEQEIFSRFFQEEKIKVLNTLSEAIKNSLRERHFYVAGIEDIPSRRLNSVATWIFEQVYTKTIPFRFDGFSAKAGSGSRDCLALIMALVNRQVNGDWVALQQTSLQNRVTQLLVKDWKVLGSDGKLCRDIGNENLAEILQMMEKSHQEDDNRSLGSTFKELLSPPYGFNASSAGIVLGLFLAKEFPPRSVTIDGQSCTLEEWLVKVLPNKKGTHSFNLKALDKTNLHFLEEDSYQRWNKRLIKVENETSYCEILSLVEKAEEQFNADPIPEILMGRFLYIRDKAKAAKKHLASYEGEISKFEAKVSQNERLVNVENLIRLGSEIVKFTKNIRLEGSVWEKIQVSQLEDLLSDVKELLDGKLIDWIASRSCQSIERISDFRRDSEEKINELKTIGLLKEAHSLEDKMCKIIALTEARAKYVVSLNKAEDIIRQPSPTLHNKAISLRQDIETIDDLAQIVGTANDLIDCDDIRVLIDGLQLRKGLLLTIEQQQKQQLVEIYNFHIQDIQDVDNLLSHIKELHHTFSGTKDENTVVDVYKQLMIIKEDMQRWSSLEMPYEELSMLFEEQVAQRAKEVMTQLEIDESKPFWDIPMIYMNFKENTINYRKQQSAQWTIDIIPNIDEISSWSITDSERQLSKLHAAPAWVSLGDRCDIAQIVELIQSQIDKSKEIEKQKVAKAWLVKMRIGVKVADARNEVYCQKLASDLNKIPEFLHDSDYEEVHNLRRKVQGYIDEMHIDDIFERICSLSEPLKVTLISQLQRKFSGLF